MRKITIHETPIGPIDIVINDNQPSIIISARGGWMFAKPHTGDDGVELDFGYVRSENQVISK